MEEVQQPEIEQRCSRDTDFESRISHQWTCITVRPVPKDHAAASNAQEERREGCGNRVGIVPEQEAEFAHPQHLVDQACESRGEEQRAGEEAVLPLRHRIGNRRA